MRHFKSLTGPFLSVLFIQGVVLAQSVDCPTIVKNALTAADQFCKETGRNEACYGNITLTAEAQSGIQDFTFEQPGDRTSLNTIQSLVLSPMDSENQTWGIALLRVQANLPDTLPGQNVTFLMFGDVNITDAQRSNVETSQPVASTVTITMRTSMNMRSGSSTSDTIVGKLTAGENLEADGRNAAGDWLHVQTADGQSGWVFAQLVTIHGDSSLLPVIANNNPSTAQPTAEAAVQYTPMQAFYFKTGVADAPCAEAPDSGVLIQTPQGAGHIDLLVNEIEISLGSTVYLQAQPNANMTIYVVEGQATVSAQGTTVVAPAGTEVSVPIGGNLSATGVPTPLQPYNATKLQALPVSYLPDPITVATPLLTTVGSPTPSVTPPENTPQDALPVSGNWCPTATGCTATVFPTAVQFTYEDDGAVLILTYGGGEERYTRTEPGVYMWSQGGTTAVLRVLSSSHFTQAFTFAGGNTSSADWTLLEAASGAPAP